MKLNLIIVCFVAFACSINRVLSTIPLTEQVYFYHYSYGAQQNGTELKLGETIDPEIDVFLPWKFFIHGFTTSPATSPWFHTTKDAYFLKGEYNVVFVDWSNPANQTYFESVKNAIHCGRFFGKILKFLNYHGVTERNMHLIGHSLGAHMAGFAGKYYFNVTGRNIGRITGLDPAGPYYEFNPLLPQVKYLRPPEFRLAKDDANFVDVIHTDGYYYGMASSVGHVDFYPNGGTAMQPGCENTDDDNCSHARSTLFFVESILNNTFVARECENFNSYLSGLCDNYQMTLMGEDTDQRFNGKYYLTTNAQQPYGKGDQHFFIKRKIINQGSKQNWEKEQTIIIIFIVTIFNI